MEAEFWTPGYIVLSKGAIFHSDRGIQYASEDFRKAFNTEKALGFSLYEPVEFRKKNSA
ncbi:hypothetical protein LSS_15466 [Leptospira santarosai serovar Shermani str. LT 821]|uniref:Uncharacterized protein n=1 Tax=Leptospira santarosai serovar Shermani str. LT 821 TaxID=758847 RepID=K8XWQ9_9LEPT|nr:hypothetical protein LSS_15466 [Leptospira santarosai serovar Shermani str. LT 821]